MQAMLLIAVCVIAVPDRPNPSPMQAPPLHEQLLGEWQLDKHILSGNDIAPNGLVMVFTRDALQHVYPQNGAQPAQTFPYTLDITRSPAVIHFRSANYVAIVKAEGDQLTLCFAKNGDTIAPLEYVSPPDSGMTVLRATRIKK